MPGEYNAINAIASALAVSSLNLDIDNSVNTCLSALHNFQGIPGRMQIINTCNLDKDVTVIVDFALTEKAMSEVLQSSKKFTNNGKIIVVFGASGGQHDDSVHPGLAKSTAKYADIQIVTDDEPYDGDPDEIRDNLVNYIKNTDENAEVYNIADRKKAIEQAIELSKDGDVIIVSGMGHYESRTVNGNEMK
jgi:UDP-N-acetylmuramoyl-L-alanyl-D-glutamate--2,6-diaminopimelate ligase